MDWADFTYKTDTGMNTLHTPRKLRSSKENINCKFFGQSVRVSVILLSRSAYVGAGGWRMMIRVYWLAGW